MANEGYDVRAATSVPEALAELARASFDAAVLDAHPATRPAWRSSARSRACPPAAVAVVLTGYHGPATADRALRAGAHVHLAKPCDVEVLKRVLRGEPGPPWDAPPAA